MEPTERRSILLCVYVCVLQAKEEEARNEIVRADRSLRGRARTRNIGKFFYFGGTFIYAATALGAMRLPMATAYGVAIPIALLTMG